MVKGASRLPAGKVARRLRQAAPPPDTNPQARAFPGLDCGAVGCKHFGASGRATLGLSSDKGTVTLGANFTTKANGHELGRRSVEIALHFSLRRG